MKIKKEEKANASKEANQPIVVHPGVILQKKLDEMSMSVKEFALRVTKSTSTINDILKGKGSITPEIALAFENVTLESAHYWLDLQSRHDEYGARMRLNNSSEEISKWMMNFPLMVMIVKGWVAAGKTVEESANHLLSFFGVSSVKAWEDYYLRRVLNTTFRISLTGVKELHIVTAWLRRGELQAKEMHLKQSYSEQKLRDKLPRLAELMEEHNQNYNEENAIRYENKVKRVLQEAGVKMVITPLLPKISIYGCTRWFGETPCIQMAHECFSAEYPWSVLFHEIGHILLHGKKEVFLEGLYYAEREEAKEKKANQFARRYIDEYYWDDGFLNLKNEYDASYWFPKRRTIKASSVDFLELPFDNDDDDDDNEPQRRLIVISKHP